MNVQNMKLNTFIDGESQVGTYHIVQYIKEQDQKVEKQETIVDKNGCTKRIVHLYVNVKKISIPNGWNARTSRHALRRIKGGGPQFESKLVQDGQHTRVEYYIDANGQLSSRNITYNTQTKNINIPLTIVNVGDSQDNYMRKWKQEDCFNILKKQAQELNQYDEYPSKIIIAARYSYTDDYGKRRRRICVRNVRLTRKEKLIETRRRTLEIPNNEYNHFIIYQDEETFYCRHQCGYTGEKVIIRNKKTTYFTTNTQDFTSKIINEYGTYKHYMQETIDNWKNTNRDNVLDNKQNGVWLTDLHYLKRTIIKDAVYLCIDKDKEESECMAQYFNATQTDYDRETENKCRCCVKHTNPVKAISQATSEQGRRLLREAIRQYSMIYPTTAFNYTLIEKNYGLSYDSNGQIPNYQCLGDFEVHISCKN